MEQIESLRSDVATLYQRVTGSPLSSGRFSEHPLPLPPNIEPVGFLRRELGLLTAIIDQRLAPEPSVSNQRFAPAADTFEDTRSYTVRVELPGFAKQDLELFVGENILRIQGERRPEQGGDLRLVSSERAYGTFERWVTFPFPVDRDSVRVKLENGLLEIRIAKAVQANQDMESVPIP
jgi:HSP20 family protein